VWFFDGGGFCANYEDCAVRWCGENFPYGERHMSSGPLPQGIGGDGIMSTDPANTFQGWNLVFAAYCTSDLWGGARSDVVFDGNPPYRLHFEGAQVAEDGIDAGVAGLVSDDGEMVLPSLADAERVLVGGTSAGCNGAASHTDAVEAAAPGAVVTTVLDSCLYPEPSVLGPTYQPLWEDQLARFWDEVYTPVYGTEPDPDCALAYKDELWRCVDLNTLVREEFSRVMIHHDQSDPIIYAFFDTLGMSMAQYADAAIDTYRLYEEDAPHVSIHSNNCGEHTSIDGDGTFLRMTVVDAESGGPALSLHDVLAVSADGGRSIAVDSSPPATSVCP
jgi:Pectinacetylesterase